VLDTYVYIDGWNLYYGAIKSTPYRWLDLHALSCNLLNRGYCVRKVRYFTARVDDRPDDLQQSQRQDAYIRALRTIPEIEVHFGRFATNVKRVRLAKPRSNGAKTVEAIITEEKGSDVMLATNLVWDSAHKCMAAALVISNDSDLQESLNMARKLGVKVITCNPHDHKKQPLHLSGDETRNLRKRHLGKSLLPTEIRDKKGKLIVARPPRWEP
jgi:uncharacterized LabA/DUF88 family protein